MFSIDPVGCDDLDGALSIKVGVPWFMPYKGLKVTLCYHVHHNIACGVLIVLGTCTCFFDLGSTAVVALTLPVPSMPSHPPSPQHTLPVPSTPSPSPAYLTPSPAHPLPSTPSHSHPLCPQHTLTACRIRD